MAVLVLSSRAMRLRSATSWSTRALPRDFAQVVLGVEDDRVGGRPGAAEAGVGRGEEPGSELCLAARATTISSISSGEARGGLVAVADGAGVLAPRRAFSRRRGVHLDALLDCATGALPSSRIGAMCSRERHGGQLAAGALGAGRMGGELSERLRSRGWPGGGRARSNRGRACRQWACAAGGLGGGLGARPPRLCGGLLGGDCGSAGSYFGRFPEARPSPAQRVGRDGRVERCAAERCAQGFAVVGPRAVGSGEAEASCWRLVGSSAWRNRSAKLGSLASCWAISSLELAEHGRVEPLPTPRCRRAGSDPRRPVPESGRTPSSGVAVSVICTLPGELAGRWLVAG